MSCAAVMIALNMKWKNIKVLFHAEVKDGQWCLTCSSVLKEWKL